ncbi:MAG: hypothetical protein ACR2RF_02710 [Geminicoccaceae bacterium]
MTTLGIDVIAPHCYLATIDDLTCSKMPRSVGAYFGLTTRHFASGEVDWTGWILKCVDATQIMHWTWRRPFGGMNMPC